MLNLANRTGVEVIPVVFGEKFTSEESLVPGCIVIMKNPIPHTSLIWLLLPNVLLEMLQNVTAEFSTDGLALGAKFSCS